MQIHSKPVLQKDSHLLYFNTAISLHLAFRQEEFEDTKGATRIRISKKNRQHNGQKKKYKRKKKRSTRHTYKTKDRVTRTPLKTGALFCLFTKYPVS
jgi:hypothetical protein